MPERNPLVAIGDTLTMKLPKDQSVSVSFLIENLNGAVGATLIPEVSDDDGLVWEAVSVQPVGGGAAVLSLAAVGSAWARLPSYTHARLRLSALTSGGPIVGRINVSDGI